MVEKPPFERQDLQLDQVQFAQDLDGTITHVGHLPSSLLFGLFRSYLEGNVKNREEMSGREMGSRTEKLHGLDSNLVE